MPPPPENSQTSGSSSGCGCLLLLIIVGCFLFFRYRQPRPGDFREQPTLEEQFAEEEGFQDGSFKAQPPPPSVPSPTVRTPKPTAGQPARQVEEWMKAPNWTRAKARNIDDLTEKDREAIYNWADDKESLRDRLDAFNDTFREISSQPAYQYDKSKLDEARRLADAIQRCIDANDPLRIVYSLQTPFESAFRDFSASVVWRQGVRHPTAPHIHSGRSRDSWEPDDGYIFANASSGDLSVIYKGHAYRCSRCKGSGSIVQSVTCPRCQGTGRIPNPIVQGANIVSGFAELADSFSKHPGQHRARQINDAGLVCPQCNGHRNLQQTVACPDCENGTVWR